MILSIPTMLPLPDKAFKPREPGADTYSSDYTKKKVGLPEVLLVEQFVPGSHLLAHFHKTDQFQVFTDGDGKMGRVPYSPLSVFYTNKDTGYGPIVAGDAGTSYYVFRPSYSPETSKTWWLHEPETRAEITRGGKRMLKATNIGVKPVGELKSLSAPAFDKVISVEPDDADAGVLAEVVSLGPNTPYVGVDPKSGGGQVFFVISGTLVRGGETLGERSSLAVTLDEGPVAFSSSDDGLQLLFMQYPRRN